MIRHGQKVCDGMVKRRTCGKPAAYWFIDRDLCRLHYEQLKKTATDYAQVTKRSAVA